MKILQVVHGFPPFNIAGTEVYAYNLCRELTKKNKTFIFHRINELRLREYEVISRSLGDLEIFMINNTFRLYNSFEMTYRNDIVAEKFALLLNEINPDIVHIQNLLYLSVKIIAEIKKRNIPIVFTLHDYWLICPQGQLLRNNLKACDRENSRECISCVLPHLSIKKYLFNAYYLLRNSIPERLFQLVKNIYLVCSKFSLSANQQAISLIEERSAYMRGICAKVDLFIAPSQFLRKIFIEFGIPQNKIIFLPHGFDLDKFKDLGKTPSVKLRFGLIGNLLPAKGAHLAIECFNKIKNDNAELKIYGPFMSYKGILGNYLHRIRKMVRNRNIRFMGGFDNKDIAKIFAEIDVLVVPSIWYENSPLVIQEAFASKTPVIASRIGGIPELIDDGVNGFLVKPNDIDDLYKRISQIIDNLSLIDDIRKNIRPPKNIEENAREMEEIYSDLIAQNRLCGVK